jgi:hypothetical protein
MRVGERSRAQLQRRPRDREGFQVNSDARMASTCLDTETPNSRPKSSSRPLVRTDKTLRFEVSAKDRR